MTQSSAIRPQPDDPATRLIGMMRGYQISQALHAAVRTGLAEAMSEVPQTAVTLAAATGTDAGALDRLLRVLASQGLVRRQDGAGENAYALTPLGRLMRRDAPGSVRGQILLWGHPSQWQAWGVLEHSIRTGETAFAHVHGLGFWPYLDRDPETREVFQAAMADHPSHRELPRLHDFSACRHIVDVGGGRGHLLVALLSVLPGLTGELLERPEVIGAAAEVIGAAGLSARIRLRGGDFFADMPEGADRYILSNVLMDWDDAGALRLLSACRAAAGAAGRILVVERVVPDDDAPTLGQLGNLMALAITGGRMRSLAEHDRLLAAAGLERRTATLTAAGYAVIEAGADPALRPG